MVCIFKKGHLRVCSTYQGVTLLSLSGKPYSRMLDRKLQSTVQPWFQVEQCRFCPNHETVDQLITLTRLSNGSSLHISCGLGEGMQPSKEPCKGVLQEYEVLVLLLPAIWSFCDQSVTLAKVIPVFSGCPLLLVQFVIFQLRDLRIASLLFADYMVASSHCEHGVE